MVLVRHARRGGRLRRGLLRGLSPVRRGSVSRTVGMLQDAGRGLTGQVRRLVRIAEIGAGLSVQERQKRAEKKKEKESDAGMFEKVHFFRPCLNPRIPGTCRAPAFISTVSGVP